MYRKLSIAALVAALSFPAFAVQALWTGGVERVQTVTFKWVLRCEYHLYTQTFWKLIDAATCPSSIEVQ